MGMFGEISSANSVDVIASRIKKLWDKETNSKVKEAYKNAIIECAHGAEWDTNDCYKQILKEVKTYKEDNNEADFPGH